MEQDKSLETLKQGALATRREVRGAEDFPDSSVVIPRLIIGQPDNLTGYAEGRFVNNLSSDTYESLKVVLLKFKRSRTLWPPGKPRLGDEPSCRSLDAKVPDKEFYGRLCNRCNDVHQLCVEEKETAICQHAKFTSDGRPECRLAYHLLLINAENADVFILTLTGKGISPTNRLISNFKVKGKPVYSARFDISLDKAKDGKYYIIKYSNFSWLESPEELKEIFEAFKHAPITPSREEEISATTSNHTEEPAGDM